jgi:hypothetical protein
VWRDAVRGGPRASLRVKLVAVALCLLAAGAAVILTAGASALRGQLTRQAGGRLRLYANQLASNSFQVLGTSQGAPAAIVPFDGTGTGGEARAPGTAERVGAASAARTPSAASASAAPRASAGASASAVPSGPTAPPTMVAVFVGPPGISIELRGPGGQLLLSAGPGTRAGPALPKPFAPVPARTGVLRSVAGVGGSYLVIAEPVHFTARRLVFGYGADDFAITGGSRVGATGQTGTLVVGLRLASIDRPVRRLTLLAVPVSAAAIVLAGGLAWAAIRFSLRPVTRALHIADAAAAGMPGDGGELVHPVPERPAGDLAGDLAGPAGDLAGPASSMAGPASSMAGPASSMAGPASSMAGPASSMAGPASGMAGSLGTALGQLDGQLTASVDAEAAARAATEQLAARLESVTEALRRPISLLHGRAEHWANQDRRGSSDPDRALTQIAAYAADAEALLDEMGGALFTDPIPPNQGKAPTDPHRTREETPGP